MLHIDWLTKLRYFLQTVAFCLAVAAIEYMFQPQIPYECEMVYSLGIGLSIWASVDLGRHAFPSAAETGWPQGLWAWLLPLVGIGNGFVLGTLWCGLANSFHALLAARIFTGIFGGVIGSVVMAIATDLFLPDQRGRVMGFIQTAFAASQILGLPAGIYLSNHWNWHAPFLVMVVFGIVGRPRLTRHPGSMKSEPSVSVVIPCRIVG